MVLGKNVTVFDWEWGRNSAPRDGQKRPWPIYLGVFKTVLFSEWICLFDMDLKLKKNTATNGLTNSHNT